MNDEIINKVAQSSLITIDIKDFYPKREEYECFDITNFLYERLVLKEKDFRKALKELDYSAYQNKYVCIFCSEDVIIPQWAYLLAAVHLYPYAKKIFYGNEKEVIQKIICDKINEMNVEPFKERPIVIKGCSDVKIEMDAYVLLIQKLMLVAKSVMYGEPCSTVPLFKKK